MKVFGVLGHQGQGAGCCFRYALLQLVMVAYQRLHRSCAHVRELVPDRKLMVGKGARGFGRDGSETLVQGFRAVG